MNGCCSRPDGTAAVSGTFDGLIQVILFPRGGVCFASGSVRHTEFTVVLLSDCHSQAVRSCDGAQQISHCVLCDLCYSVTRCVSRPAGVVSPGVPWL